MRCPKGLFALALLAISPCTSFLKYRNQHQEDRRDHGRDWNGEHGRARFQGELSANRCEGNRGGAHLWVAFRKGSDKEAVVMVT